MHDPSSGILSRWDLIIKRKLRLYFLIYLHLVKYSTTEKDHLPLSLTCTLVSEADSCVWIQTFFSPLCLAFNVLPLFLSNWTCYITSYNKTILSPSRNSLKLLCQSSKCLNDMMSRVSLTKLFSLILQFHNQMIYSSIHLISFSSYLNKFEGLLRIC